MAQAMVNFRMDAELKRKMEALCKEMGLTMTTAFTIYAAKVVRERKIPFEISAEEDPFYSEENMADLKRRIADIEAGRNVSEHELIEVD